MAEAAGKQQGRVSPGDDVQERRCILSGAAMDRRHLLRLVLDPDGCIVPDLKEKLPGRGIWISLDRAALEKAIAARKLTRAVARSLKAPVGPDVVPDDFAAMIDAQLATAVLDRLGLARRAGFVVTGQEAVGQAIRAGEVALVLQARDAAPDSARKLGQALHAASLPPALTVFDRNELSLALGGDNVVQAALSARPRDRSRMAGMADGLKLAITRLTRYRAPAGDAKLNDKPLTERRADA